MNQEWCGWPSSKLRTRSGKNPQQANTKQILVYFSSGDLTVDVWNTKPGSNQSRVGLPEGTTFFPHHPRPCEKREASGLFGVSNLKVAPATTGMSFLGGGIWYESKGDSVNIFAKVKYRFSYCKDIAMCAYAFTYTYVHHGPPKPTVLEGF